MPKDEKKPKKTHKSVAERRLEMWAHCLNNGWMIHVKQDTLFKNTKQGMQRLCFQDSKVIVLEAKRPVPKEMQGKQNLGFVPIAAAPVSQVQMGEDGLVFPQSEKPKERRG